MLVAVEMSSRRGWKWNAGWLLTHLPEPPWEAVNRVPPANPVWSMRGLAAPDWVAATAQHLRDIATLAEVEKKGPPPKVTKEKGKETAPKEHS